MKHITFYEHNGTAYTITVHTRLLPEVVRKMQCVLYGDNGKPKGTFQIYGKTGLLLSIPGHRLRAGYTVRNA